MGNAEQGGNVRIIAIRQEEAVPWDDVDQALEGKLDCGEGIEDIGVIKFDVIDDDQFWQIMDEFGTFIEKGSVIFISFNDKPITFCKACTLLQVRWDSANQKAGVAPAVFKYPCEERGGGRFAMRARNHEGTFAANEELLQ